jgi:uncharacterized cupredoxin-like copper-binding protein
MDFKAYWAKAKTLGITAIVAGALTLTLAACGGDANTGSATATTGSTGTSPTATTATGGGAVDTPVGGKTNRVDVKLDEWTIQPPNVQLPAGSTTFVATNEGEFSHNFVLQKDGTDVGGTPVFSAGESPKEVTLDLQPGTYTTLCTVPGHAQKGMTGKLTVAP